MLGISDQIQVSFLLFSLMVRAHFRLLYSKTLLDSNLDAAEGLLNLSFRIVEALFGKNSDLHAQYYDRL